MTGERINSALQAELKLKFGITFEEFLPRPREGDARQYNLAEYNPQEGYVRLDEVIDVFGKRQGKPEVFVEYVALGDEENTVARREAHSERWTGTSGIRHAEIEYIQEDVKTTYGTPPYQFQYDDGQRYGERITGGTISVGVKDIADPSLYPFDLVHGFYASEGRLFTLDLSYGDRSELQDYYHKKKEANERARRGLVFGGHDLSFLGVEFRTPDEESADYRIADRMRGVFQAGFSGVIRIGERLAPKEIEPYAYEIDNQQGQFIARRIDTVSGSIWTASVPERIDFMKLYTKSTTPGRDWTTVRQDFPVELNFQ